MSEEWFWRIPPKSLRRTAAVQDSTTWRIAALSSEPLCLLSIGSSSKNRKKSVAACRPVYHDRLFRPKSAGLDNLSAEFQTETLPGRDSDERYARHSTGTILKLRM